MDQKKEVYKNKLNSSIINLQVLRGTILAKKPPYPFLTPTINNAVATMADLLLYLEEKHPYHQGFNEKFFNDRQVTMHGTFFNQILIDTEVGIREVLDSKDIEIQNSIQRRSKKIVDRIKEKQVNTSKIDKELSEIIKLGPTKPSFIDVLDTVLLHLHSIDENYKKFSKIYFKALGILRNKQHHVYIKPTEAERKILIQGKFGNALTKEGDLQMTFEGYLPIVKDVIQFFDKIEVNS